MIDTADLGIPATTIFPFGCAATLFQRRYSRATMAVSLKATRLAQRMEDEEPRGKFSFHPAEIMRENKQCPRATKKQK